MHAPCSRAVRNRAGPGCCGESSAVHGTRPTVARARRQSNTWHAPCSRAGQGWCCGMLCSLWNALGVRFRSRSPLTRSLQQGSEESGQARVLWRVLRYTERCRGESSAAGPPLARSLQQGGEGSGQGWCCGVFCGLWSAAGVKARRRLPLARSLQGGEESEQGWCCGESSAVHGTMPIVPWARRQSYRWNAPCNREVENHGSIVNSNSGSEPACELDGKAVVVVCRVAVGCHTSPSSGK